MVKHYRDSKQRNQMVGISGGQHRTSSVSQAKMSCSKTSRSKNAERKFETKKQISKSSGKRKVVAYKYIDSSSSETSSEDYSSSSDSSSYYSDDERSPPKRTKKSGSKSYENGHSEATEEEFVVEKIVDVMEDHSGKPFYLVKWLNYSSEDNTWEPLENLSKCQDLIDEFARDYERSKRSNNNNYKQSSDVSVPLKTPGVKKAQKNPSTTKDSKKNNHNRKNGFSKVPLERNLMITSMHKVADIELHSEPKQKRKDKRPNIGQETPNNGHEKSNIQVEKPNTQAEKPIIEDKKSNIDEKVQINVTKFLQQVISQPVVQNTYLAIPHAGDLYYLKIIDDIDGTVNWLYIDLSVPCTDPDTLYRCIVTEDLTGKQPKLIYGATEDIHGEKFCMVQFEGHSYVEIIPPSNFFMQFPSFRRYFEVHCPHIFVKNSH